MLRRVVFVIIFVVILAAAVIIWFLTHFKQTNSITQIDPCNIQNSSYAQASDVATKQLVDQIASSCKKTTNQVLVTFNGTKYSFSYPSDYQVKQDVNKPNGSEAVYLARSYHGSNSISVDYFPFPDGLSQYPSVKFRRLNPKIYTEGKGDLTGLKGVSFVANGPDTYERSVFTMKGGLLVSVAVSSNGPGSFLDDDFSTVISTFKWK